MLSAFIGGTGGADGAGGAGGASGAGGAGGGFFIGVCAGFIAGGGGGGGAGVCCVTCGRTGVLGLELNAFMLLFVCCFSWFPDPESRDGTGGNAGVFTLGDCGGSTCLTGPGPDGSLAGKAGRTKLL